jgi:hypothetical protein
MKLEKTTFLPQHISLSFSLSFSRIVTVFNTAASNVIIQVTSTSERFDHTNGAESACTRTHTRSLNASRKARLVLTTMHFSQFRLPDHPSLRILGGNAGNNFDSSLSASGRRTASLSEARVPARAENAKRDYGDTRHVRVHPQKERASNWRHAVRRRRDGRSVGVYVRFNTGWPREKRPQAAIAQARARSLASASARAWPKKSSAKAPTLRARAIPRQGSSRELRFVPLARLADALRAATMATNQKGISPDDDATPPVALCRSSRVPKACSDSLPTQLR